MKAWLFGAAAALISGLGNGLTGWAVGLTPKQLIAILAVNAITHVGAYLARSPLPGHSAVPVLPE